VCKRVTDLTKITVVPVSIVRNAAKRPAISELRIILIEIPPYGLKPWHWVRPDGQCHCGNRIREDSVSVSLCVRYAICSEQSAVTTSKAARCYVEKCIGSQL